MAAVTVVAKAVAAWRDRLRPAPAVCRIGSSSPGLYTAALGVRPCALARWEESRRISRWVRYRCSGGNGACPAKAGQGGAHPFAITTSALAVALAGVGLATAPAAHASVQDCITMVEQLGVALPEELQPARSVPTGADWAV